MATFFCLLDEQGDDRCKLQLDLQNDKNPPSVGAIRAALKQELNCRSSDLILYRQSNTSKGWTNVNESDCQRLVDDGSIYEDSIVFVKRRDRMNQPQGPPPENDFRTTYKRRNSPPSHDSPNKRRGSIDVNPVSKRRSPARHESPYKEDESLSIEKPNRQQNMRKIRRVGDTDVGRSRGGPNSGANTGSGWYDNKYPETSEGGYRRPLLRRNVSPHFDRRARWAPSNTVGESGFWNASNSRKLEVNQVSLFKLRPGRCKLDIFGFWIY
eukprot:Blabericola_migrator_1__3590@NODE_2069_length_3325_cov_180_217004_g422_i1_p2_GENE_NODE_2069_length_3325_cov_180_217004_g422_i1NODE_2069_length_3325_cov_180_217004_g422_i1_p2_ORF_typecomplete_len268_score43_64_NODE_2069_length_3325_cov_180_217004_g422_i1121924